MESKQNSSSGYRQSSATLVLLEECTAEADELFYKFYRLLRWEWRGGVSFSNVLHAVLPLRLHSITWFAHCKPVGWNMGEVTVCNSIWINACHLESRQIGLKDTTKYVSEENRGHICSFSSHISRVDGFFGWFVGFFESNLVEIELSNIYNTSA